MASSTTASGNPLKAILRQTIKAKLKSMSAESMRHQSNTITNKILSSDAFKSSERVSIYLSMNDSEVCTLEILKELFRLGKTVFVPTYEGKLMEMVRLKDMSDYESLELTKWNIKQPKITENRENALTRDGLDLFVMPGVAFTRNGGRCGHGMGYYDKYLQKHFELFPNRRSSDDDPKLNIQSKIQQRKTILIGLAFKEQIVESEVLPLEEHDLLLDWIVSAD